MTAEIAARRDGRPKPITGSELSGDQQRRTNNSDHVDARSQPTPRALATIGPSSRHRTLTNLNPRPSRYALPDVDLSPA